MLKIKNTLIGGICAIAIILFSCESQAAFVEEEEAIKIPMTLQLCAAWSAIEVQDKEKILHKLQNLRSYNFTPIVEALVPLVKDFAPDFKNTLYISWMIELLDSIESEDISGYLDIVTTLVPKSKNADSVHTLLKVLVSQKSISAAQTLVDDAKPLTDFLTNKDGFQNLFEYLSPVPPKKRKLIVEALVPLVKEFVPDYCNALFTGLMIELLGKVDPGHIPGYIDLLHKRKFDQESSKETYNTLKVIIKRLPFYG